MPPRKRPTSTTPPHDAPPTITTKGSTHSSSSDLTPDGRESAPSGDFMSWLLMGGGPDIENSSMNGMDPTSAGFDPIPVDQMDAMYPQAAEQLPQTAPQQHTQQHQVHEDPYQNDQQRYQPEQYQPTYPPSSSSTVVDTQTQDQLRQLQQMMAMQQDMLMRISAQQGIAMPPPPRAERSRSPTPQPTMAMGGATTASAMGGMNDENNPNKRMKKVTSSDSEKKLAELKAENVSLKRHLDSSSKKHVKVKEEKVKNVATMERMVKRLKENPQGEKGGKGDERYDTTPEGLYKFIKSYTDMYSDYGTSRAGELEFHLAQLSRLVMPTTTTKMGLWTLEQDDKFFHNIQKGSLAGILARELMITAQQMKKIIAHRENIQNITKSLKRTLELLGQLKSISFKKHSLFKDRMEKCTKILEPVQVLKMLLWVHKHESELKDLCPGWGSEQILPEKDNGVTKQMAPGREHEQMAPGREHEPVP